MLRVHEEDHAGRASMTRTAHPQLVPVTTRASQPKLLMRMLMPDALDREYPNAPADWRRQWVLPQENRWKNAKTAEQGRHHVDKSLVQKAAREAVTRAGLTKRAA